MFFNRFAKSICFIPALLLVSSCEYFQERTAKEFLTAPFTASEADYTREAVDMKPAALRNSGAIVLCRLRQCAPTKLSMSREYVYNSLLQLFDNNNYQKALICQADPASRTCLEEYVTLPIMAGITPTHAYIDHVKITDVIIGKQADKINLVLNYNVTYGGQTPDCTPSKSILFAKNVNHVLLEDAGYTCKMTSIGQTTVKTVFAIDYIDLDYGYIGGFYSIGMSGPAHGGGSGYMLLRLPKNAYPLSPVLATQDHRSLGRKKKSPATSAAEESGFSKASSAEEDENNLGKVLVFPLAKSTATPPQEETLPQEESSAE